MCSSDLFLAYSRANEKDKAKAVLEERVQNDPKNEVAIQNLANFELMNGSYDAAEGTIKRVLADPKTFTNGHEAVGDFYLRTRKFDQALQQYQSGINEDSKNAVAYKERIISVYQATNRHNDALNLARSLAKDNPKNLSANQMYAALLLQTDSVDSITKSIPELKELLKSNPTDSLLHLDLARAYFETNDRDKSLTEALEAMQDEIKSAQNAVPPHAPRLQIIDNARNLQGRIYEDRGQHAKAMEQANMILQNDPKNPDAQLVKDRAMAGIGQADAALPQVEALVQQYPNMGGARLELANLYMGRREFDKAAVQYQQYAKQFPNDLRGPVGLESVKLAQGKGDEAVNDMQALVNQ